MTKNRKDLQTAFNNAASNFIIDIEDFMPIGCPCISCKHLGVNGMAGCEAFPDIEIPDEILEGELDHSVRHPAQKNDILFEPIEDYQWTTKP